MGCLLTYKQLPLEELPAGRYTLVVAAKEPSGRMVASSSIVFNLEAGNRRLAQRAFASEQLGADDAGLYEYQRGLILLNQGQAAEALPRLRTASLKSPGLTNLGVDLAKLELDQGNAAEAVAALERVRVNKDFPTSSFLLCGKAYAAAGRKEDADKALAEFLRVIQPSRSEFQELAAVYERLGEADKAAEMRKGAEALAPSKTE